MSYSTLMTNIWPPPNDEVRSRLERLQELKQLREKRESTQSGTLPSRTDSGDSEGTRLSRRQLLNTRTLPTSRLREKQGERLKATLEKKSQSSSLSQETNSRADYGGARPKNFSTSLRGSSSETSEILASIRRRENNGLTGKERQRTISADSDTFDDHEPSNNVLNRATSARLTSTGSPGCPGDELEAGVKPQDVSVESESADHTEDIESFKQSLYGTTKTKTTQQGKVLVPFTDPSSLIDSSKLSNRIMTSSKSESKGKLGDSARWRKNVPQSKDKTTVLNGEKYETSNGLADVKNGGLDSNMETSTVMSSLTSEKSETVSEQQSENGKALVFDGESLTVTGEVESNTKILLGHDNVLSEHSIQTETNGEVTENTDSSVYGLLDQVVHGSFSVREQTSDFSVPGPADNSSYKDSILNESDSILNESDSIFDSRYEENFEEEDTFPDRDAWQSNRWGGESTTSYRSAWQTDRQNFDRSSGYAPKQSRRDVLTANRTKQPATRITRYASLPSSADSRVSEFRSKYLSRDYSEPYTSSYGDDSSTTSYRETRQEDISSRLGNILSDSFKKFDSVLDGSDVQRRYEDSSKSFRTTEDQPRSVRRSYSQRGESDTESRLGRFRRTSETNNDTDSRLGQYRRTNSDSEYRSQYDSPTPQPDLGMTEFISNIRSRMSGMNPVSESQNKPLARSGGVSSVLENAKRMLLGITDEPELSDSDEQFRNMRLQTEQLTDSLLPAEDSGDITEPLMESHAPMEENKYVSQNLNNGEISESDVQMVEDEDNVTEVLLEKGNVIQLTSELDKQLDNSEKASENIKSVHQDGEIALINKTASNQLQVHAESVENEAKAKSSAKVYKAEQLKNSEVDMESESAKLEKTTDNSPSPKKQNSTKGKNKKKKKGKKRKDSENKSDTSSNIDSKSLDGKKIEISQSEDILTVTIEDSTAVEDKQKETTESVGEQLESMISDIDHRSEKTSVATEDLLSLNGKEEESESGSSKTESSVSKATSSKSSDESNQTTKSQIHGENSVAVSEEDLLAATKNKEDGTDRLGHLQADCEQFETASEEEFYEATPGEYGDEEGNVFVEHREKFIYVTGGSKVRKRKLSRKSLLGEKQSEEVKAQADSSRFGHVKEWMESHIFPSNNTVHEKDLGVKSSDHGSQLSVNSTLGDFDSRGSLGSKEMLDEGKTITNDSIHSGDTFKTNAALEKRDMSVQTNVSSLNTQNIGTQMLIKARNIGVQIDSELYDKFVQTLGELVCPCCNNIINIQEGFITSAKDRDVQKIKEELKLKLGVENEGQTKVERSISSSDTSPKSKSSSSQNSVTASPRSPSLTSSVKQKQVEKVPPITLGKQSPSTVKRNNSVREMTTKKSPATTPRKQSPTRKSPATTPRKQSPTRKSPATTPRNKSPTRKSPASTPRKQSPTRKSPASTPRKQSPTRKSPTTTPRNKSPARKSPATTPRKQSPTRKSPASTPRKQSPARKQSPSREDATTPRNKKTSTNSAGLSNGEANKGNSKVRKEKVSSVQDLLFENGEQTTEKKPEGKRRPTTPKPGKREKTPDRKKREASAERRSDDDASEKSDLPSYMQSTKSSRRKKSIGNSEELLEENKQKKGMPTTPRKSVTEEEQEGFTTMNDNPFVRSDRQRTSLGPIGQGTSGKWYRKEPLKDEEESKKGKTRTPKKQRSSSVSSTTSEKNVVNGNSKINSKNVLKSDERLDLSGLGSQSSLLETDLDEAMGYNNSGGNLDSDDTQVFIDTIPFTNSHFLGPDLKTYAENISKNIAEKEVLKLEGDNNQNENSAKSNVKLSLPPPGAESEEKEAEVTQTLDGKEDATSRQKLLSEEEQAGVPVETEEGEDEVAPVRVNLSSWDPTKLLKDLYAVQLMPDDAKDISDKFVAMEGLMEKLPMNKKKATLLKTWKRRFFRAKDGWLYYYETSSRDKPSDTLQLMGGKVDDLGNRILGIDDGRGKYLMVRCPTDKEYGQWKLALESQTADNVKATYVRPVLSCPQHPQKKVILIDIGSSAIRAGILGEHATLPTLFFPNVVAHSGDSKELAVGIEAFKPEYRKTTSKTVHPTDKVDKFSIDMSTIGAVFKKVFTDLKVEPSEYWLMISTPQNLGDKIRAGLMETLIDKYGVQGVCMVMQSLLALYSYNATSGIIVDVGERMEILPIYDGFVIEGGVSRQSYGGQKVIESLNSCLQGYNFSTPIQQLLVRYVMEQSCYLVNDYKETLKKCEEDPDSYKATVYLNNFDLPEGATMEVTHDYSCFKSPEGFFNTDLWGMDYPCVHKLVFQAIQSCPIDSRKRMYRAIFLSGGVTRLPGFAERLQCELQKLAPPSVMVEVHASPQRYHSAYIGACSLANMEQFKQICISAEEWKKDGVKTFKKWNMAG
ncbi:uncharacterized protein LOC134279321 isoform X2 [Saccostrea cucullata]|uniref:uncharacterized protein LOC134279321 isoform X2 n=1 Tax=Saccostrea cuccullata TaxID=36930 RepID=UPI002ED2B8A0